MLKVQLLTQWKDFLVCVCVNWKSGWAPNEPKGSVCMGMAMVIRNIWQKIEVDFGILVILSSKNVRLKLRDPDLV
jgi:hypothetical protein